MDDPSTNKGPVFCLVRLRELVREILHLHLIFRKTAFIQLKAIYHILATMPENMIESFGYVSSRVYEAGATMCRKSL